MTRIDAFFYRSHAKLTVRGALVLSVLLIASIFPEVLFCKGSYLPSNVLRARMLGPSGEVSAVYPSLEQRQVSHGYRDLGAAAWQVEPGQNFMKRVFETCDSPYWNPYAGCGSLGPESLVGEMFSPISIAVALGGAGTGVFHVVTLIVFVMSTLAFLLAVYNYLQVPLFGALAAGYLYWLNGFHISNLSGGPAHSYVLAPVVLFALLAAHERWTPGRGFLAVTAHVGLMSCTTVPTTVLMVISVHVLALCFVYARHGWSRRTLSCLWKQAATPILALLILGPLWFPILESLGVSSLWGGYNARELQTESFLGMISLFSPKHFWESYNGLPGVITELGSWKDLMRDANDIYHLGVIPMLTMSLVAARARWMRNPIVIGMAVLMLVSLGRIFGLPPFVLIGDLPGFKVFRIPYWGAMTCFAATFLFAMACRHLHDPRMRLSPAAVPAGLLLGLLLLIRSRLGFPTTQHRYSLYVLLILVMVFFVYLAAVSWFRWRGRSARLVFFGLVFLELIFYANTKRPVRLDSHEATPRYVAFLEEHLGDGRLLNVGLWSLFPERATMYSLRQVGTNSTSSLPWFEKYFHDHLGDDGGGLTLGMHGDQPVRIKPEALDLLAVRFVVVDRYMDSYLRYFVERKYPVVYADAVRLIFENPGSLPRVYCATGFEQKGGIPEQGSTRVARTEDLRLFSLANLEGVSSQLPSSEPCVITDQVWRNSRVGLTVHSSRPSLLVVSDSWHPGWSATVNGRETYLGRVDQTLRGVIVPAGTNRVEMLYRAPGLSAGLWTSGVTLLSLLALNCLWIWRLRRNEASAEDTKVDGDSLPA